MFNASESLARGKFNVLVGHVVLEIDEGFSRSIAYPPERRAGWRFRCCFGRYDARCYETQFIQGGASRSRSVGETIGKFTVPSGRPSDPHAGRWIDGKKSANFGVPNGPVAEMGR
jgi:hypothetical protein